MQLPVIPRSVYLYRLLLIIALILVASATLNAQAELSYEELVLLAREYGLDPSGNRLVLEARLGELLVLDDERPRAVPPESRLLAEVQEADSASYVRRESGDELELQGNVIISVDDEQFSLRHLISADLIIYNQALRQLSAEGNVHYEMAGEAGQQDRFFGEKLLFLLDENETLFVRGEGEAENSSDSEAAEIYRRLGGEEELDYRFSARFITRTQNNVIIMDEGRISSSRGGEQPYYRIDFDKLWLLSPGEWGVDGARLYVGNIPLLALPFFYLPGNEVLFHPVFVYADARGYGLNTTTYLAGRRESSESPFSFLQMTDDLQTSGQRPMGIFLQPDNNPLPDTWARRTFETFKLIADLYSARGGSIGLSASALSEEGQNAEILLALGFTRELYPGLDGLSYTSGYTDGSGEVYPVWHQSYLFGLNIPFRFILDTRLGWNFGSLSLDLDLPVYSDPTYLREFTQRSEQMPWDQLLFTGVAQGQSPSFGTEAMAWSLRMSYTPNVAESLGPVVSSFRMSNYVSSFTWQISSNDDIPAANAVAVNSPEDLIYAPSQFQFPSGLTSLSGTLFEYTGGKREVEAAAEDADPITGLWPPDAFSSGSGIRSRDSGDEDGREPFDQQAADIGIPLPASSGLSLSAPEAPQSGYKPSTGKPLEYRLSYSLTNNHFITALFHGPDEVAGLQSKYFSIQDNAQVNINQNLGLAEGFFVASSQLSYSGAIRRNLGYSSLLTGTEIDSLETSAFAQERQSLVISNTATLNFLQPWYTDDRLDLVHRLGIRAWQTSRESDGSLNTRVFDGTAETFSAHAASLTYTSAPGDRGITHRLGVDAVLPPLAVSLNASYAFGSETVDAILASGLNVAGGGVEFEEITASVDFTPAENLKLSAAGGFSIQESRLDQLGFVLSSPRYAGSLDLALRNLLELNGTKTAWIESGADRFTLSSMSHRLNQSFSIGSLGRGELTGSVSASWDHDFVEYTSSVLSFEASLRLFFPRLLLVELSSNSNNTQMYRYFTPYNAALGLPDRNIISDLFSSFNFFSRQDRQSSPFNLQSCAVDLYHDLGDWMLRVNYRWQPRVVTGDDGQAEFELLNSLSVYLQWLPITELKNEIEITSASGEPKVFVDY
jgi:hypothetical protein